MCRCSLDNVVAVAAIARDDTQLLIFGLALAILIMALFASVIMKVMLKYKWLSWAGPGFPGLSDSDDAV